MNHLFFHFFSKLFCRSSSRFRILLSACRSFDIVLALQCGQFVASPHKSFFSHHVDSHLLFELSDPLQVCPHFCFFLFTFMFLSWPRVDMSAASFPSFPPRLSLLTYGFDPPRPDGTAAFFYLIIPALIAPLVTFFPSKSPFPLFLPTPSFFGRVI